MPKQKLPYFKWFPKDFDTDENVKMMNIEEIGLYALCLNHQWVNGSLPSDPAEISRAMKIPPAQFKRAWKRVSACFESIDGRLINPRLADERTKALRKSQNNSKSARTRYERSTNVERSKYDPATNVLPHTCDSYISGESAERGEIADCWAVSGWPSPEDFENWWTALVKKHPNKNKNGIAKQKAIELVMAGRLKRKPFEVGYTEAKKRAGARWLENNGQYAPNLWQIFDDRIWEFSGSAPEEPHRETPAERRAREEREDLEEQQQRAARLAAGGGSQ